MHKEGATATVSVFSRWGKRLGTVYLAQMPEAGQAALSDELTELLRDVLGKWDGPLLRLVYITDAGYHSTEYYRRVLSRLVDLRGRDGQLHWEWIVDYYHVCQHISDLAEAIFGPGRAAYAWAAKMCRWLRDKPGGVFRVLRSAGALRAIRALGRRGIGLPGGLRLPAPACRVDGLPPLPPDACPHRQWGYRGGLQGGLDAALQTRRDEVVPHDGRPRIDPSRNRPERRVDRRAPGGACLLCYPNPSN